MQPTYLPWIGYFVLLDQVDKFVILDDVQYERKSWQCRNRIFENGKIEYIEVPVVKSPLTETIFNIKIDQSKRWKELHSNRLTQSYEHTTYFDELMEIITNVFDQEHHFLADINIDLISRIAVNLNIDTPIVRASGLGCAGKRSDHVGEICKAMSADNYISPEGAREYLTEDRFEEKTGIKVSYQDFDVVPYPQPPLSSFLSHLSIVDMLAHCGIKNTSTYIKDAIK